MQWTAPSTTSASCQKLDQVQTKTRTEYESMEFVELCPLRETKASTVRLYVCLHHMHNSCNTDPGLQDSWAKRRVKSRTDRESIHTAGAKFEKDVRLVGKNQEKQGLSFLSTSLLLFAYTTGNKCFNLLYNYYKWLPFYELKICVTAETFQLICLS